MPPNEAGRSVRCRDRDKRSEVRMDLRQSSAGLTVAESRDGRSRVAGAKPQQFRAGKPRCSKNATLIIRALSLKCINMHTCTKKNAPLTGRFLISAKPTGCRIIRQLW